MRILELDILVTCLVTVLSRPTDNNQNETEGVVAGTEWQPEGRDKGDWLSCHGLPCSRWEEAQRTATVINMLDAASPAAFLSAAGSPGQVEVKEGEEGADILLTPEQADQLLHKTLADRYGTGDENPTRRKRKIDSDLFIRWSLPIVYKFDGEHLATEKATIREAIQTWQTNTCVRFHEVGTHEKIHYNHLMFTRQYGCFSFVGNLDIVPRGNPQQINLGPGCLSKLGVAIHEIGHVLGLWHEHQRPNRDNFLDIIHDNIGIWARNNFLRRPVDKMDDFGVPYDFNSVMQYSGKVASLNGDLTIRTRDPLYQKNLGQRVELSFLDAKVINMAYCQGYCNNYPKLRCLNGGYMNPNNCNVCLCPDGLSGKLCDQPLPSVGGYCSDTLELREGEHVSLATPDYYTSGSYIDGTRCNWLVKAKVGSTLYARFEGQFGVFQSGDKCHHWVEVKTKRDFTHPGYRFCGGSAPKTLLASEGQQLLITFRSLLPSYRGSYKRGFKITVTAVREGEKPPTLTNTPPQTTTRQVSTRRATRAPTTRVTTRRTTTRVTTTRPTTTTRQTTTTKPTISTTTSTTTRQPTTRSTTTPFRYSGRVKLTWSSWSHCLGHPCQCGSYSARKRIRLCNGEICEGALYREENLSCDQLCTPKDLETIYVGKFYQRQCKVCTTGFMNGGGRCVPV